MLDHIMRFTAPAAYDLLPAEMASPAATAMLLAIGLQESGFTARRQQRGGPARGFWQFERDGGTYGVLTHQRSKAHATAVLRALQYHGLVGNVKGCYAALEHNDTLAFVFARLLVWTLPEALPDRESPTAAWAQYLHAWRPGKPQRETWDQHFATAWARVEGPVL